MNNYNIHNKSQKNYYFLDIHHRIQKYKFIIRYKYNPKLINFYFLPRVQKLFN